MKKALPFVVSVGLIMGMGPVIAGSISYQENTYESKVVPLGALQGADAGVPIGGEVHDIAGLISELGAQVTSTGQIIVTLEADVLFDFDKADVKPAMDRKLGLLAELIVSKKTKRAVIKGYTDSKGSDEYNQRLSVERAASVKTWLVSRGGVPASVLRAEGFGENNPVAPNVFEDGRDNPGGRAKNRRVEVVLEP